MRDNPRYKIGSDPVVYYSEATGMGHFADSDSAVFNRIVRKVFSEDEIRRYRDASGSIYIAYVVIMGGFWKLVLTSGFRTMI